MKTIALFVVFLFALGVLVAAGANNCNGLPNNLPIVTDAPVLLRTVAQGKLYQAGQGDNQFFVAHVYGTPYQMGYAHGSLLQKEINLIVDEFYKYMGTQIDQYIKFLPKELRELVEKYGVEAALEATYMFTRRQTPAHVFDELKGLADATGLPYNKVLWLHQFPELIKAACSMFGAWGPATASANGTLFQLRALDFDTGGPFQQYPLVLVYHPNAGNGHAFAILTWAGFVGAMTGFSSAPVGVCEKVWLGYNGTSSRIGAPWHFVLRDILQYDVDVDSAISRMTAVERTCAIFVGLGDTVTNQFRGVEYSHQYLNVYDDTNYPPTPTHPQLAGVMYWDKHVQPSGDPCMPSLLQQYYGSLNAENTIKYITSQFQTGDLHIAVYDYANMFMYVANASPGPNVVPAYNRQFTRLDMRAAFALAL